MQNRTKIRKRQIAAQEKYLQDLEDEQQKLEYIRETVAVFDAIYFYLGQPHFSEPERERIRTCLLYLSRGVLD